ncbi:hypothetical protein FVW27_09285 [Desulfovibrio sp. XJ01]|nr:hypothetical protein [Nitratidesulfovibrio liaohensis]
MLNEVKMMNIEQQAMAYIKEMLGKIPLVQSVKSCTQGVSCGGHTLDLVLQVNVGGCEHLLVCEVKDRAQPQQVRAALLMLRESLRRDGRDMTPVFMAPYLSPQARALCVEHDVGYLDLAGNARIAFDGIFIEREVVDKPKAVRREVKSLFKPKSARVLRVLLRQPHRAWRVADLADAAQVSLGHVSNVRRKLLAEEWGEDSGSGLFLLKPDALLDAWRKVYEPPAGERREYYTSLHGEAFDAAVRGVSGTALGCILLASFSAGRWLAPYLRSGTQYFYADVSGLALLVSTLHLVRVDKGGNVVVTVPTDEGILQDAIQPAPGIACTSPVQTYLDLCALGERGAEAADNLRREKLAWSN